VLHVGLELPFDVLEEVLAATAMELERNQTKIANPGPKDDVEVIAVLHIPRFVVLLSNFIYRVLFYLKTGGNGLQRNNSSLLGDNNN